MNHDEFCGPWKDVFWMDGGLCESRINKMKYEFMTFMLILSRRNTFSGISGFHDDDKDKNDGEDCHGGLLHLAGIVLYSDFWKFSVSGSGMGWFP
jgi:hypothetical protein